jgi:RNA polymerase sigma-70 factor (ECF subfamily)
MDMEPDDEPSTTAAFEACMATQYPRLVARLTLIVRDPQEARDLAQETLVRAWQSWPTLRPAEVGGWLQMVGSRLALDELRRRKRRPWSRLADHEIPSAVTVDPDVWDALGAMAPEERAAIVLNVLGGYTQSEIATHLGVAPGTVASWSSRGRRHLRDTLQTKGGSP